MKETKMFSQINKLLAVIIITFFAFLNNQKVSAQGMASPVKAKNVENKTTESRRLVTGNTEALKKSMVASQESGLIIKAEILEGQKVLKGTVLIELDDTRLKLELEMDKQQTQKALNYLNQKEIELKDVSDELSRLLKAEKQSAGATSQLEIQKVQKNVDLAKANRSIAEQDHKSSLTKEAFTETRLKDMIIHAPFDGVIIRKNIEIGEWINPGSPILTLHSIGEYRINFEIPEIIPMNELKTLTKIEVSLSGNTKQFMADRLQLIPDVNTRSRVYIMSAIIKDDENLMAAGQSVQANIPISQKRDYLVVPTDAVNKDVGGSFVYKIIPDGKGGFMVLPANIKILFLEGSSYYIESSSLNAGDQIVVEGNERLRPMMPVSVIPESKK
jgi:RND family efflux transporter MFP subunit